MNVTDTVAVCACQLSVPGKIPGFSGKNPTQQLAVRQLSYGFTIHLANAIKRGVLQAAHYRSMNPYNHNVFNYVVCYCGQQLILSPTTEQRVPSTATPVGYYVGLQRKQLAHNSSVYVQFLYNNMLLTGVRLNSPNHICNHVNSTKLQPMTPLTLVNMARLLILFELT